MLKKRKGDKMRKLFVLLIVLTMFVATAKAEDLEKWVEVDDNMKEGAITEKRYRFYKEDKVGEYLENNSELESNYEYKDNKDIKYLDYSDWFEECDVDSNIYDIEYKTLNVYQKIVPIRFLVLKDFSEDTSIKNIKILNKEKIVDFEILSCANCSNNLEEIGKNSIIKLYFNEEVEVNDISIEIEFIDNDIDYQIILSNDSELKNISLQNIVSSDQIKLDIDDSWLQNSNYSNAFYEIDEIDTDIFTKSLGSKDMCRYRKYLVFNYNINKVYYDDNYYTNVLGYIKDESDYKVYYKNKINANSKVINNLSIKTEEKIVDSKSKELEDDKNIEHIEENVEVIKKDNNYIKKENDKKITTKADTKLVKTLSISDNKSIIKYVILIVIGLTIIYIIYSNRRIVIKK